MSGGNDIDDLHQTINGLRAICQVRPQRLEQTRIHRVGDGRNASAFRAARKSACRRVWTDGSYSRPRPGPTYRWDKPRCGADTGAPPRQVRI